MSVETSSQKLWQFSDAELDNILLDVSDEGAPTLPQPITAPRQHVQLPSEKGMVTPLPASLPEAENQRLPQTLPGLDFESVLVPPRPSALSAVQRISNAAKTPAPRPVSLHQVPIDHTSAMPPASLVSQSNPLRFADGLLHLEMFEATPRFDIEAAATACGVPVMTLKLWERRYGLPAPWQGENSYALYSGRDLAVAQWLREQITRGQTVRQAMTKLLLLEPQYTPHQGSHPLTSVVPLPRDLKAMQDPLLRAFTTQQESLAEQLLGEAFASAPAAIVCTSLLQPVLLQIVEMRQRMNVPLAIELLAAKVTRSQVVALVEAGLGPKDALHYLSSLVLKAPEVLTATRQEQQQGRPDLVKLEERLLIAIRNMNEVSAQQLLDDAFLHYPVEEVCMNLIQAVLYRVGMLWAEKQISIPIEHFASNLIRTRLAHIFQSTPNLHQGPAIFVGCAPKETHEIGVLMLALFWRRAGLNVSYLGQLVELKSLIQEIRKRQPGIVCLSATMRPHVKDIAEAARDITRMEHPRPIFCFGGGAFGQDAALIKKVKGVYLGTNAAMATQRLKELVRMQMSFSVEEIEGMGILPK